MTVLYRAIATEHVDDAFTGDVVAWPGAVLGRQSGYLSRSAAKNAGERSGIAFEIVKSEPVVFLTAEQRLVRDIRELTEELERVRLGVLKAVAS
ncbi:hypothetical protein O1W71_16395 [Microbacterium sp. H37-C3]|uniref:hypothetical protein n=1 Tax=Microbacterium sp. H37-C3 TaxID=3004354 RepID=UPI0022AFACE0|nr:hypothetical protein [Microbacterium sp. H37-C3]MCZ4069251.1 hypothetical protein [Microbacterium sp. H37-C3]